MIPVLTPTAVREYLERSIQAQEVAMKRGDEGALYRHDTLCAVKRDLLGGWTAYSKDRIGTDQTAVGE